MPRHCAVTSRCRHSGCHRCVTPAAENSGFESCDAQVTVGWFNPGEMTGGTAEDEKGGHSSRPVLRYLAAFVICALALGYLAAVLTGWVSLSRRFGVTEVVLAIAALAAASALVSPGLVQSISRIRLGTLELDLRELRRGQQNQIQQLDEVQLFLRLLLSEKERRYLEDLSLDKQAPHTGDDELYAALRRLRAVGLIKNRAGHRVHDLVRGQRQDIHQFVEITEDGRRYLQRISDR